jgi:methionine sulfoxide reductase heme-binding subunit
MTQRDPMEMVWWLASRASGVVALALIGMSVALGFAMAAKAFKAPLPRMLMAVHEHAAVAALIAIAVHGITLLGDKWLDPGPLGILVPFHMDHEPLWTGLGIIGGYLAAALGLSFYARRRIGTKRWRSLHKATILVYVLSVLHTLGAGSDASTPWLRAQIVLTGAPIVFLFVMRVLPAAKTGAAGRPVGAVSGDASAAPRGSAPSPVPHSARSQPSRSA